MLDPNGLDANYFYGDFLIKRGEIDKAKAVLAHALEAPPDPARPVWDAGPARRSPCPARESQRWTCGVNGVGADAHVWRSIGEQLRHPTGLAGRVAGALMRIANERPNSLAVEALRIEPHDTVLELGFGPGRAIEAIACQAFAGHVYGVDHSSLMHRQASRRNWLAIREGRVTLRRASFDCLPFDQACIDKLLAVNVIYFWDDLVGIAREIRRVLRPGDVPPCMRPIRRR